MKIYSVLIDFISVLQSCGQQKKPRKTDACEALHPLYTEGMSIIAKAIEFC